jgi:hypothetical protein
VKFPLIFILLLTACTAFGQYFPPINGGGSGGGSGNIVTPSSPTTGQTVSAGTTKANETLYITPAGTLPALNISLPSAANSQVGQIIRVYISQIITTLTPSVSGGGVINGNAPDTSLIKSSFAYQCVSVSGAGTWIMLYQ